ncbi:MAG: hypothetical protein V3V92_01850 [Candidatus Hydrothermarchaeales archaeon]
MELSKQRKNSRVAVQVKGDKNGEFFYKIMSTGPVQCLEDDVYLITEEQLKEVTKLKIPYKIKSR